MISNLFPPIVSFVDDPTIEVKIWNIKAGHLVWSSSCNAVYRFHALWRVVNLFLGCKGCGRYGCQATTHDILFITLMSRFWFFTCIYIYTHLNIPTRWGRSQVDDFARHHSSGTAACHRFGSIGLPCFGCLVAREVWMVWTSEKPNIAPSKQMSLTSKFQESMFAF